MSLQKCFFRVQSSNPVLPPETWTLVYDNHTPGAYSETFGWGKYKIQLSGGGGAGGAASGTDYASTHNRATNGSAGKLFNSTFNVVYDSFRTISGIVGGGGASSSANIGTYFVGSAGVGDPSGVRGSGMSREGSSGAAGGSGGGATSATGIGVAAGGNGGDGWAESNSSHRSTGYGGAGGTGSNQGTGAAGGVGAWARNNPATSGAGTNGWVKIYKSNLYPEPV